MRRAIKGAGPNGRESASGPGIDEPRSRGDFMLQQHANCPSGDDLNFSGSQGSAAEQLRRKTIACATAVAQFVRLAEPGAARWGYEAVSQGCGIQAQLHTLRPRGCRSPPPARRRGTCPFPPAESRVDVCKALSVRCSAAAVCRAGEGIAQIRGSRDVALRWRSSSHRQQAGRPARPSTCRG